MPCTLWESEREVGGGGRPNNLENDDLRWEVRAGSIFSALCFRRPAPGKDAPLHASVFEEFNMGLLFLFPPLRCQQCVPRRPSGDYVFFVEQFTPSA